ncbi:MAG: hypothetical protein VYC80_06910 [Planctomycetota bacterium]|nr:hypothetical protein [Planctomycetota bacterium]
MNRRKAKKLERLVSAFATGLMVVTPMSLNAQEDGTNRSNLDWPLAENQCSEYLYEVYSKSPELSGPIPKNQNDFPEARVSPAIPAICDDLVGHDWSSFGGHHTEGVRLSRRFSNLPPRQERKTSCDTLKRLAALDWTSVGDDPEFAGHLDFQGTCYEQSLNLRTLPEHHPFTDSSSLTDLVERAVSSAISKVRTLNEEYRPYDMVIADPLSGSRAVDYWQAHQNLNIDPTTPEKVTKPVDYWQAHQHLNIEAYRARGLSYWDAHQHLDVDPVASAKKNNAVDYWRAHQHLDIEAYRTIELSYWDAHRNLDITPRKETRSIDMELWAAAPSLLSTYQSWIVTHPYVQSPARAQRDFWQYVELKLYGTEALERWHQLMHLKPSVSPQSPIEPTTPVHAETVLWFADLLDQTGRQFQRASSHLTQIVERSARHSRLR